MGSSPRPESWPGKVRPTPRTVAKGFGETALVICNGEPPGKGLALPLSRTAGLVVAADGGANVARELGIRPDIVIGDFDSIKPATKKFFLSSEFIHVRRQDNTDLEKALDYLVEQKVNHVTIIAATGKRLDHTLGNLSVIWNYVRQIDLMVAGDGWLALPVGKQTTASARVGTTVSLVPFGNCSGITLRGLHYPLTNATMKVGEIGVSNVVAKSPFTVQVRKGNMLMMILDDQNRIELLR